MTTTWEMLLTTALLGTERRAPQLPPDSPAPLHELASGDPEHLLLSAASIMSVYQRAGYTPTTDPRALGAAAPEDTLPYCSLRAASRLLQLLTHPDLHRLLIGEWLLTITGKGKRIPHFLLPEVLQPGKDDNALVALLVPVLGERGRWLVTQNSEWCKYQKVIDDPSPTWIEALFARAVPPEEVLRTEAEALESINTKTLQDQYVFAPVSKCRHLWSDALTEAFLARMMTAHEKKVRLVLESETISLFVASVPHGSLSLAIQRLKSVAKDEKYIFFHPVIELLDLRQHMLQELSYE